MPRVRRTPPPETPKAVLTMSDTDIPQLLSSGPSDNVNAASRSNKRPRACFSPGTELQDFKSEIHQMLRSWKEEQQAYLTKFCDDHTFSLNKLVSELAEIRRQNLEIQKSHLEFEKTLNFISIQYDDMLKQTNALQKEKELLRETVRNLDTKIHDLQRLSRPSSIEIRNIPVREGEAAADLHTIITKVGSSVNVSLNNTHVRDVYRLPGKPGSVRPIVAEFSTVSTKNELLAAVRDYNKKHPNDDRINTQTIGLAGEPRPIYISEHLSAGSKKLFFAAKEFAKLKGYVFCWTTNGNIFLRKIAGAKPILVKSEQTLHDLQHSGTP